MIGQWPVMPGSDWLRYIAIVSGLISFDWPGHKSSPDLSDSDQPRIRDGSHSIAQWKQIGPTHWNNADAKPIDCIRWESDNLATHSHGQFASFSKTDPKLPFQRLNLNVQRNDQSNKTINIHSMPSRSNKPGSCLGNSIIVFATHFQCSRN